MNEERQMRTDCAGCGAPLNDSPERYKKEGNYCEKCCRGAQRRSDLRAKINTVQGEIDRLLAPEKIDEERLESAFAHLTELREKLEDEIAKCPQYSEGVSTGKLARVPYGRASTPPLE